MPDGVFREEAMTGCVATDTAAGYRYLRMHYSCDPEKDASWAASVSLGVPKREWAREMELDEDVYDGEPVYADWHEPTHCPSAFKRGPIPIINGSTYFGGWDVGQTLIPAFALLQVTPLKQVHCILEVVSKGGEPMEVFAPRVMQALIKRLPGSWDEVYHGADATVRQRNGVDGRTAQEEAKRHGFHLKSVSNEWQSRYGAVTWLLRDMIDEECPRFFLDGVNCPVLRQAFSGAYKYEEIAKGDNAGPGRVLAMPLKNSFSHVSDALQYASVLARKYVQAG